MHGPFGSLQRRRNRESRTSRIVQIQEPAVILLGPSLTLVRCHTLPSKNVFSKTRSWVGGVAAFLARCFRTRSAPLLATSAPVPALSARVSASAQLEARDLGAARNGGFSRLAFAPCGGAAWILSAPAF